jgi:adenosine/AMP kinase
MELQFECITIEKDEGTSAILGHAGFIKTIEDLYEAMASSVPGVKFGIAFAEASGPCPSANLLDLRIETANGPYSAKRMKLSASIVVRRTCVG